MPVPRPAVGLGAEGARLVLARLGGKDLPAERRLDCEIVWRESA